MSKRKTSLESELLKLAERSNPRATDSGVHRSRYSHKHCGRGP